MKFCESLKYLDGRGPRGWRSEASNGPWIGILTPDSE